MLTINPIKFNTYNKKYISFGENQNNNNSRVRILDVNANTRINFEKDLFESKKTDMVQTNPLKVIGYSLVKAYNSLSTPSREHTQSTKTTYRHLPYMA